MSKSSSARKQRRQREEQLLAKLGMTRNDLRESVNAANLLNLYLDGRPQ